MKKFAFLLFVFIVIWGYPASAQERTMVWRHWDVIIDNFDTYQNQFDVAEIYDVQFTGSFSWGSAVIPLNNLDDIRDIRVYEEDVLLTSGCSQAPGTYCVEDINEGRSIIYYFLQPVTDASRKFRIEYTIVGALRVYKENDALWWIAIPPEHFGFKIAESQIIIQLPQEVIPRQGIDSVATYGVPTRVEIQGEFITVTATQAIEDNDYLEVRVEYPHNPSARKSDWQTQFDNEIRHQRIANAFGMYLSAAIFFALGSVSAATVIWYLAV